MQYCMWQSCIDKDLRSIVLKSPNYSAPLTLFFFSLLSFVPSNPLHVNKVCHSADHPICIDHIYIFVSTLNHITLNAGTTERSQRQFIHKRPVKMNE